MPKIVVSFDDTPGGLRRVLARIEPCGDLHHVASRAAVYRLARDYRVKREQVDLSEVRRALPARDPD